MRKLLSRHTHATECFTWTTAAVGKHISAFSKAVVSEVIRSQCQNDLLMMLDKATSCRDFRELERWERTVWDVLITAAYRCHECDREMAGGGGRIKGRRRGPAGVHNGLALLSRELIGWRRTMSIGSLAVRRESDVYVPTAVHTSTRSARRDRSTVSAARRSPIDSLTTADHRHRPASDDNAVITAAEYVAFLDDVSYDLKYTLQCDEIFTLTIGQFKRLPRTSVLGVYRL